MLECLFLSRQHSHVIRILTKNALCTYYLLAKLWAPAICNANYFLKWEYFKHFWFVVSRRCHVIDRQVLARCRRLEAQSVEGTTRYSCQEQLCPYIIVKLLEKLCPSVSRGAVLPSLEGSLFLFVSRRVALLPSPEELPIFPFQEGLSVPQFPEGSSALLLPEG